MKNPERGADVRFQALMAAAVDGIVVIDRSGRIEAFSRSAEEIFGYSQEEAIGSNVSLLMPSPHREEHDGYLQSYLAGAPAKIIGIGREVEGRRKDGSIFPLEISVGEAEGEAGGPFVGIVRDLTERSRIEAERLELEAEAQRNRDLLAHAGRLDVLGEMTAGIAHEISQPLAAIASYSRAAARMLRSGDFETSEASEILDKIGAQAQRAGEVIRRLRALVARRETSREEVEIEDVVAAVLVLAEPDARGRGFVLETNFSDSLPSVRVDPIQIQQILLNLIRNAIDAMQEAGLQAGPIKVYARPDGNGGVEVGVVDQGIGLAPENEEKVFNPFFSTKHEGVGIGLSLCSSILQSHGGHIGFRRNSSPGMTFFFNLPAAETEDDGR